MMTNNPILDEPIEEINVPVMKPIPPLVAKVALLKKLARNYIESMSRKAAENARKDINKFADWILALPNKPIKRGINEIEAPLRGFLKTHRIDGVRGQDQNTFINHIRPRVINFLHGRRRPIQVKFVFTCEFQKGVTEEDLEYSYGYFHTKMERVMEGTDLMEMYERMIKECLERIEAFQNEGCGWKFKEVVSFDIYVDPFRPLRGSSYFGLPAKLAAKKAIINVQNKQDNACFKWAVTSAVYRRKVHPERLNDEMRANSEKLNWEGIDFPTPLDQITKFEKQNPYSINVYGYAKSIVYPLRISKHENEQCINLILLVNKEKNHHYCWIKNMSALTASQYNKHKGKRYVCKYCCNSFQSEETLRKHIEYCSNQKAVKVVMPEKGTRLYFKNYQRKMRVPFVVYADFEAFTTYSNYDL